MEVLGAETDNTIMVGDRIYDLNGAATIGISSIGVRYGYAAEGELEKGNASAIVSSPMEIITALEKINGKASF